MTARRTAVNLVCASSLGLAAIGLAGCSAAPDPAGSSTSTSMTSTATSTSTSATPPGSGSSTTSGTGSATSTSTGTSTATGTGTTSTTATGTESPTSTASSTTSPSATSTSSSTTTASPSPTSPKPKPTPSTPPPLTDTSTMKPGDSGAAVKRMQQRLSDLGYWLGTPDGEYGGLTTQAVLALQKTAGLGRDGVYGPNTRAALDRGVRPKLVVGGNGVQINLATQVLTIVEGGAIRVILNTSTGSGQTYVSQGQTKVAVTPKGTFSIFREVNGPDPSPLGMLYRSKYFNGGIAVHGYSSVPAYPASHGCARVSNPAIDMIWAKGLMPIGRTVVVF